MRLEIDSVVVADSTGAESVRLGILLAAKPDPFCALESCWLQHLESAHCASRPPTATTTSDYRSAHPSTTSPG